ncbi:MAG: phage/plasmid primase, P4 family [Halobacteriaceae archaeon]
MGDGGTMTRIPAPDTLPDTLAERDQWLLWSKQSDPPKCPLNADGEPASWTDPAQWLSFEEAHQLATERDAFDGVGFVIAENDPLTGLDLDGCLREAWEPKPEDWLPPIDELQATYCEFSTSGTGIHVIAEDSPVPGWWSDTHNSDEEHQGVEAYHQKFFIVTGEPLETAAETIRSVDLDEWLTDAWLALNNDLPVSHPAADTPERVPDDEPDVDRAREALSHIDPDVAYNKWRNIAFALVDYFDGDSRAQRLFEEWSQGGTKWDSDAQEYVNRIFRDASPGGGVSAGTLFYYAQQNGWEPSPREPTDDDDRRDAVDNPDGVTDWQGVRDCYEFETVKHGRQAAAAKLLDEYSFATPMDTEHLWLYDPESGMYERNGAAVVQKILSAELGVHDSQTERREILSKVRARTYIKREEFDGGDENLLCCANGVLDLDTRELHDHDADYLFTRAIPVEYDPEAEAPAIEEFLDQITRREEDKLTLLEMVGAALWPAPLRNKFLILFGEGANGKSTWFETVTELLGEENVAGWELQNLSENRFAASDLVGKFANIAPDMPGTKLTEMGTLKTLTGDDTTMVEQKGEPAFPFRNKATLMFGANRPPVIPESSRASRARGCSRTAVSSRKPPSIRSTGRGGLRCCPYCCWSCSVTGGSGPAAGRSSA